MGSSPVAVTYIAENLTNYELISEWIMNITLKMKDEPWTLFQVYAPETSYVDVEIDLVNENLQNLNQL